MAKNIYVGNLVWDATADDLLALFQQHGVVTRAQVNALVPFYAIGVFTGFTMAGFGMARYFGRRREPGWRAKVTLNVLSGGASLVIVLIFAVVKFTEGAWLVVVLFPLLVWVTWIGGLPFTLVLVGAAGVSALELTSMLTPIGYPELFGVAVAGLLPLGPWWAELPPY